MPAPQKPWERKNRDTSGSSATPLGPSKALDGASKPWEQTAVTAAGASSSPATVRNRPWETSTSGQTSTYGATSNNRPYGGWNSGYGTNSMYNRPGYSSYGGSSYGGYNRLGGPSYGSGMGSYGGLGSQFGGYGSQYGSSFGNYGGGFGSYGGGGYGSYGGLGGGMGGYGPPGLGGPYGQPGGPDQPPQPPTAWQSMLQAMSGVVNFFGRVSFLVDENAHAFYFLITALLQFLDRCGSLYGELARFILRMLGLRARKAAGKELVASPQEPPPGVNAAPPSQGIRGFIAGPGPQPPGFDSIWGS